MQMFLLDFPKQTWLLQKMLLSMANNPIVFAMANPDPEIGL